MLSVPDAGSATSTSRPAAAQPGVVMGRRDLGPGERLRENERMRNTDGSILSIGSSGSILSIGSAGSILSIGSAGSILSIGSAGSIASVLSVGRPRASDPSCRRCPAGRCWPGGGGPAESRPPDRGGRLPDVSWQDRGRVDGSAPSRAALRWAVGQARLTGGTVEAVIAWQLPMMLMNHGWAPIYLEEEADFGDDASKRIDAVISEEVVPADSHLVHDPGRARPSGAGPARRREPRGPARGGQPGPWRLRRGTARLGEPALRHHARCPVLIVR